MHHIRPNRRHRRFRSKIDGLTRHARVGSKMAFYEKFQGGKPGSKGKRNFVIKRKKTKSASQLRDPMRAKCPFFAKALYDFEGQGEHEIRSVSKDDLFTVSIVSHTKWCLVETGDGREGWIPIDYIERVHPRLDPALAYEAARTQQIGVRKQRQAAELALEEAKKSGDSARIQAATIALARIAAKEKRIARTVEALQQAQVALADKARAEERLRKVEAQNDTKGTENAKQMAQEAGDRVDGAMELMKIAKTAERVENEIESVRAADELKQAAPSDSKKNAQVVILERGEAAAATLALHQKSLQNRQDQAAVLLKLRSQGAEDAKIAQALAVVKMADAEAQASRRAAQVAAAQPTRELKQLAEKIVRLQDAVQANPTPANKTALREAQAEFDAANKRAEALDAYRGALVEVYESIVNLNAARRKGDKQEIAAAEKILAEKTAAARAAGEAYAAVNGGKAFAFRGAAVDDPADMAVESSLDDARLASAPPQDSALSFGKNHQPVVACIQRTNVFNEARKKGMLAVYLIDVDRALAAGGRDPAATVAAIDYMSRLGMQVESMKDLADKIKSTLEAWVPEKKKVRDILAREGKWTPSDKDINRIFNESLAGTSASVFLQQAKGFGAGSAKAVIETLRTCIVRQESQDRMAKQAVMRWVQSKLEGKAFTVSMGDFNAIFNGKSPRQVYSLTQELDVAKRSFDTFADIFIALVGDASAKPPSYLEKRSSAKADIQKVVLRFITDPLCVFFRSSTLRVQGSQMRQLIERYGESKNSASQLLTDMSLIHATGAAFPSFSALVATLGDGKTIPALRADAEQKLSCIQPGLEAQIDAVTAGAKHRFNAMQRVLAAVSKANAAAATPGELARVATAELARLAKDEPSERKAAIDFLSSKSIFSQQTKVTASMIRGLVRQVLYSAGGVKGIRVAAVLGGFLSEDRLFKSFAELTDAAAKAVAC